MVFSDAHPSSRRTSLFYVHYKAGRFYRANGRRLGTMADLPLRTGRLDRLYRFNATVGRAWPHDIAVDADGRPVLVFTGRRHGAYGTDSFFYARWDGARWRRHRIVGAGRRSRTFTSGGVTLHHQRPSWVVLSRRIGRWNQVELWRTGDAGRTWAPPVRLTSAHQHSFRPVIPRDDDDPATLTVLYLRGKLKSFRNFRTVVRIDQLPTPEAAR
jgi:hypothetical protein